MNLGQENREALAVYAQRIMDLEAALKSVKATLGLSEQALEQASNSLERAENASREDYDMPSECGATRGFVRSALIEVRAALRGKL